MKGILLCLLAETPVHVGAGKASGFIDLPVARESITSYPVIPSTGLKGSFRETFRMDHDVNLLFGKEGSSDNDGQIGNIVFSEGRLLLLPVRSLTSSYKWLTCPHILERLKRDIMRTASNPEELNQIKLPVVDMGKGLGRSNGKMFLEEREFEINENVDAQIIEVLKMFIPNKEVARRLEDQLIVLNDSDFKWFVQYGLTVNARNALHKDTKASDYLWYEEVLPADSVFYMIMIERKTNMLDRVVARIEKRAYIQLGGNETVGQGWFNIKKVGSDSHG